MLFIDLEKILLASSNLRVLRLMAGIDNADSRDVISNRDHKNSFETFIVVSQRKYGHIGSRQLCWLVSSGFLVWFFTALAKLHHNLGGFHSFGQPLDILPSSTYSYHLQ